MSKEQSTVIFKTTPIHEVIYFFSQIFQKEKMQFMSWTSDSPKLDYLVAKLFLLGDPVMITAWNTALSFLTRRHKDNDRWPGYFSADSNTGSSLWNRTFWQNFIKMVQKSLPIVIPFTHHIMKNIFEWEPRFRHRRMTKYISWFFVKSSNSINMEITAAKTFSIKTTGLCDHFRIARYRHNDTYLIKTLFLCRFLFKTGSGELSGRLL